MSKIGIIARLLFGYHHSLTCDCAAKMYWQGKSYLPCNHLFIACRTVESHTPTI